MENIEPESCTTCLSRGWGCSLDERVEFHQSEKKKKKAQLTVSGSYWCHSANIKFDFSSLITKEYKNLDKIFRQDINKKTCQNNEKE